ncbi:MAG: hypothetical protein HZY76_10130 [Anaerolineae bacterium]|nr:MAG: hypothetical protein HZY76_10130 [Anaerolineae bacterium]
MWVVWQDYLNPPPAPDPGATDIRLRRLDANGAAMGNAQLVASNVGRWPVPDIACRASGVCDILWSGSGVRPASGWRVIRRTAVRRAYHDAWRRGRPMTRVVAVDGDQLWSVFAGAGHVWVTLLPGE